MVTTASSPGLMTIAGDRDPQIPAAANWHSSYIDALSAGENRRRHRTFFDAWPHVVGDYSVATNFDERALPEYQAAKKTGSLAYAGRGSTGIPDIPSYL